jgi:pyrroline-5-carboxylate reductase
MIGYGRLAKALAAQWVKTHRVIVSSPSQIHACLENGIETRNCNLKDLEEADVIVLAVKPAKMTEVISELSEVIAKDTLIISLAAGVTLSNLKNICPNHLAIIRAMPNINAQVQASATLLLKDNQLSQKHIQMAVMLFSSLGTIDWALNDDALDIGTILAGSGPAYVFYLMEAFQQSAMHLGMSEALAKKLIVQTFLGSAKLAHEKNICFQDFIAQVASPQGTTAAALEVMKSQEIPKSLDKAIQAAWQRVLSLRA